MLCAISDIEFCPISHKNCVKKRVGGYPRQLRIAVLTPFQSSVSEPVVSIFCFIASTCAAVNTPESGDQTLPNFVPVETALNGSGHDLIVEKNIHHQTRPSSALGELNLV